MTNEPRAMSKKEESLMFKKQIEERLGGRMLMTHETGVIIPHLNRKGRQFFMKRMVVTFEESLDYRRKTHDGNLKAVELKHKLLARRAKQNTK